MQPHIIATVVHSSGNNDRLVQEDSHCNADWPHDGRCLHDNHDNGNKVNTDVYTTNNNDAYIDCQNRACIIDHGNYVLDYKKDNSCDEVCLHLQQACQHRRGVASVLVSCSNNVLCGPTTNHSSLCYQWVPTNTYGINHAYGTKQGRTSWLRILLILLVVLPTLAKGKSQ